MLLEPSVCFLFFSGHLIDKPQKETVEHHWQAHISWWQFVFRGPCKVSAKPKVEAMLFREPQVIYRS